VLDDGTLLFGSELKSLLAHGGLRRDIDPLAVEEYFRARLRRRAALHLPAGAKAFAGPHALHPARRADAAPREYWDVRFTSGSAISV
jgi:asparagine synthase (glutamine-hydrolysing)